MDTPQTAPDTTELPTKSQPDQSPPPQKKRSVAKIIFIILGILLLLFMLILTAAYFFLQSQGLTPDKLNPEPKAPATTIAPRNTTTNTYKNQNYNFSMPIEKDLQVKETPYGFGVTSVELRSENTPADYGADLQMLVFPKALGVAIGQDFDKQYSLPENTKQEIKDPSGAAQNFTKVRNRMVKDLRAFEFTSSPIPADPELEAEIGIYIEMGNDVLVVTTGESHRDQLEAMLADFTYPLK